MAALQKSYGGLIAFAILAWLFAGSEIYQRAAIELIGTVVSSETSCMQPQNNRCATEYVVEANDHSRKRYIAGPTDKALPRRLPVGTAILKNKWALAYSVNGEEINDFPIVFYTGLLVFGLCCVYWWYVLSKSGSVIP